MYVVCILFYCGKGPSLGSHVFFFGGEGGSLTEMLKVWQQQLGDEDMGESRRNGEQQRLVG